MFELTLRSLLLRATVSLRVVLIQQGERRLNRFAAHWTKLAGGRIPDSLIFMKLGGSLPAKVWLLRLVSSKP
jgi:hypothetical protein